MSACRGSQPTWFLRESHNDFIKSDKWQFTHCGKKQTREESCLWSTQCLYIYICEIIITIGQLMCRRLAVICAPFALINTKKRRWSMVVTTRCGWCSFLLVVGRWSLLNTSDWNRYGAAKLRGTRRLLVLIFFFWGGRVHRTFRMMGWVTLERWSKCCCIAYLELRVTN